MIGVLGGTFDPIHIGHVQPALDLLKQLRLASVRLIPARVPPHRPQPVASPEHRLAMVRLAAREHPGLEADDRELRRDSPSYTVDTLKALRAERGLSEPLCLIVGADAFCDLNTWRRWRQIPQLAHVVVTSRPGFELPLDGEVAELLKERMLDDPQALAARPAGGILPCMVSLLDISSTAIREAIAAGGSPRGWLEPPVWEYICRHGLYRVQSRRRSLQDGDRDT
jgi:nicotinate-nucleotide adenylyltransferase